MELYPPVTLAKMLDANVPLFTTNKFIFHFYTLYVSSLVKGLSSKSSAVAQLVVGWQSAVYFSPFAFIAFNL
jgi:hypothetical protein